MNEKDWATLKAEFALRMLAVATVSEKIEFLAAMLRSVEASGAVRGTTQLADGLQAKFGHAPTLTLSEAPEMHNGMKP